VDPKVTLLKTFYRGLLADKAKLETHEHGFAYLERFSARGAALEYGELTGHSLLHKYKFTGISEGLMDELLEAHVAQTTNVCLYFHPEANELFSFNLDNNHKTRNTEPLEEMERAVVFLRQLLQEAGFDPLVVSSGRGYHLWCRLDRAVPNARLQAFMIRLAARTLAHLHQAGFDGQKLKFNFYPDLRSIDVVSLRLFGTRHAKTGAFSHILGPTGPLDEEASWVHFRALAEKAPTSVDLISGD
jgi:hypothetical protein